MLNSFGIFVDFPLQKHSRSIGPSTFTTLVYTLPYVYLFGTSVSYDTLSTKYALYQTPFGFLFVRPRIRYCFFSPKPCGLKLASRYGVHRQMVPLEDFHPGPVTCLSYQKKTLSITPRVLFVRDGDRPRELLTN